MWRTLSLTQEDINAAIATRIKERFTSIIACCPIFQSLKRQGVDVSSVWNDVAILCNGEVLSLDVDAVAVTQLVPRQWPTLTPKDYSISEPKKGGIDGSGVEGSAE